MDMTNSQAGTSVLAAGTPGFAAGTAPITASTSPADVITSAASPKVPTSNMPDKCPGGEHKPVTSFKAVKCPKCKMAICIIKGREERMSFLTSITGHQHTHAHAHAHPKRKSNIESIENHIVFAPPLKRADGSKEFSRCLNCNRIWCMTGDCNSTFTQMCNFTSHKTICPFGKPRLKDKCSKCGYSLRGSCHSDTSLWRSWYQNCCSKTSSRWTRC